MTAATYGLPALFSPGPIQAATGNNKLTKELMIPCGGIKLEALLEMPRNSGHSVPGAVICHSNPRLGGNMHNPLMNRIAGILLTEGVACLRFNFRGVGRSGGSQGDGVAELDDVKAALDFLRKIDNVKKTIAAGYSFGCYVALRAAADYPGVNALIGIAPPITTRDFEFLTKEKRPKLLVAGDRDSFCPRKRLEELLRRVPEPKRWVVVPGADHFTVGNGDVLPHEVKGFIDRSRLI